MQSTANVHAKILQLKHYQSFTHVTFLCFHFRQLSAIPGFRGISGIACPSGTSPMIFRSVCTQMFSRTPSIGVSICALLCAMKRARMVLVPDILTTLYIRDKCVWFSIKNEIKISPTVPWIAPRCVKFFTVRANHDSSRNYLIESFGKRVFHLRARVEEI